MSTGDFDPFKAGKEEGLILGELKAIHSTMDCMNRSFEDFRVGIGQRVGKMDETISHHDGSIKVLQEVVDGMKSTNVWVTRLILGAVLAALLALVLSKNESSKRENSIVSAVATR